MNKRAILFSAISFFAIGVAVMIAAFNRDVTVSILPDCSKFSDKGSASSSEDYG
jgi:hypothetical protein